MRQELIEKQRIHCATSEMNSTVYYSLSSADAELVISRFLQIWVIQLSGEQQIHSTFFSMLSVVRPLELCTLTWPPTQPYRVSSSFS